MALDTFETITVENDRVGCDGGGGSLGHPLVYLSLVADGHIECPYCSRRYVLKEGAGGGHHH